MRKTLIAFFIFLYFLLIIPSTSHAATIKNKFVDNHIYIMYTHNTVLLITKENVVIAITIFLSNIHGLGIIH